MQIIPSCPRNVVYVLAGLATVAFIPAVWVGCSPSGGADVHASEGSDGRENEEFRLPVSRKRTCVDLLLDQTIRVGTICMTIEPRGVLSVVYETIDGWELTKTHLATGDSIADIPVDDKGNPMLGRFEFNSGDITGATSHTFAVPLFKFGLERRLDDDLDRAIESCDPVTAHLAAHAALRKDNGDGTWQTQTGWAAGERMLAGGNGATLFTLSLDCDTHEPPQLEACATSFAKGDASTCFIGADFDLDGRADGIARWGWTNGPLAPGTGAAWPVYANADPCDVGKATRVGSLAVSYGRDGHAQIVFDRVGDFVLEEEHLYIGTEPLPRGQQGRFTVAPGRYPIAVELDHATHTENQVGGLHGDIYVAYHAVACLPDRSLSARAAR